MSSFRRRLLYLIIIISGCCGVYAYWQHNHLNTEKILADSVLKNKTFAAKVQKIETADLSAYLLEEHSNPIIAVSFMFQNAGSAYEAEDKQGLTALLTQMLTNGAGEFDAVKFQDTCEEYGVRLGFDSSADSINGYLQMPVTNTDMAVKLLTSALYQPHFAFDYIKLTKHQLQTAIQKHLEQPNGVLADNFSAIMFASHPYSRPYLGTPQTIEALTQKDLRDFMQTHFTQKNLLIGIAGDINAEDAKRLIYELFGRLPKQFTQKRIAEVELVSNGTMHNIEYASPQAITRFVSKGTHRNSQDFYPLYLANYIFGDSGLNSRISKVIREENGLTYGIYTYLITKDTAALLAGGYSATPENFSKAQKLLFAEWQKMGANGVTAAELSQAKSALLSSHNLRFAAIGDIAEMLVAMQQYNLGQDFLEKRNDYIKAVTLDDVNTAAKQYFTILPDFVTIGINQSEKEM